MRRIASFAGAGMLACALAVGAALGASGPPVFDIPGLAGGRIEVAGVSRLDDGGAVIAASISSHPRGANSRLVIVRLRLDGTVDLGYGTLGLSIPGVGSDVRATSLAIDPRTGAAWIGIAQGARRRAAIVALDGSGHRVRRFGRGGVQPLGAGAATGGPVVLAWRGGELLAASGNQPCRGCTISILNASSGALLKSERLSSAQGVAGACATKAITSAVFEGRSALLTAATVGPGCGVEVLTLQPPATTRPGSAAVLATLPFGNAVTTGALAAFRGSVCLAGSGKSTSELGPLSTGGTVHAPTQGPSGKLTAVVALGRRACATLIANRTGGLVLQAAGGQRHPTIDRIPRSVIPLGMFRCHQHLLVIGARRNRFGSNGVVVAIPVRRGPQANRAAAASAATGCH
jgi:hypothetical protein